MWRLFEEIKAKTDGIFGGTGGIVCCAIFGGIFFVLRKYLPHPSEFFPFNWLSLKLGIHKHENFNIILDILDCFELQEYGKYSIRVKCGREEKETFVSTSTENTHDHSNNNKIFSCSWGEKCIVFVRQREDYLFLELVSHGTFTNSTLGECKIRIMDIFEAKFPKKVTYNIQRGRKYIGKVTLSFYRISPNIFVDETTPVLFQAMINLQTDADIQGNKNICANFDKMSEKEQLIFFSKALQGNLYYLENGNNDKVRMFYFRAIEVTLNRWEWCYWMNEGDYLKGTNKLGSYSFLAMSVVIPDKFDRDRFYIKYHDFYGTHDLFFKTVDIDRDIWSEGIYEFIDRLRTYLDHIKECIPNLSPKRYLDQQEEDECDREEIGENSELIRKKLEEHSTPNNDKINQETVSKNTRTVKKYSLEKVKQLMENKPNSPSSIRRMRMEVTPIKEEEAESLVGSTGITSNTQPSILDVCRCPKSIIIAESSNKELSVGTK
ncbi:putative transmembrane protein [Cryptosporidium bovis]|uniref:putative transmembrane protein n=1 Tax=Cryptosporidium bovis TaxID=310047 RepID=UPI00351A0DAA|nr:putative transmembrane protein [Cryptosporidium bovis]